MINKIKKTIFIDKIEDNSKKLLKIRNVLNLKGINKIKKILLIKKYNELLYKNNASIPLGTEIGEGLTLPHGLSGIFISVGAKIGENCTIFQQVTIGSNTLKDSKGKGAPTIGNNVYIGAGAKIIGNVKIGDNVRIGANAVVVSDIPNNSTVVMTQPRIIIHKEEKNNKFEKYDEFSK